jgi:integration host factor subunit beta
MIKSELIERISEQNPDLRKNDIEKIVNGMLDTITDAMARADRVELRGFGVFSVRKRAARSGRNPQEPMSPLKRRMFRSSSREGKCGSG